VRHEQEDLLRRLALHDDGVMDALLCTGPNATGTPVLDARTHALVRLAGLVALDSSAATYQWGVTAALSAGASDGEIVGVLVALLPVVGSVRVQAAAPEVALALGHELGPASGR
jgi:4-carboxymuconolactone decarboxylase